MSAARTGNYVLLLLVAALAPTMLPGSSHAYTMEQQQACTGDAFRLCSSEIPDIGRITACMVRNRAQLSPGCRVYFRHGPETDQDPSALRSAHRWIGHKPRRLSEN